MHLVGSIKAGKYMCFGGLESRADRLPCYPWVLPTDETDHVAPVPRGSSI